MLLLTGILAFIFLVVGAISLIVAFIQAVKKNTKAAGKCMIVLGVCFFGLVASVLINVSLPQEESVNDSAIVSDSTSETNERATQETESEPVENTVKSLETTTQPPQEPEKVDIVDSPIVVTYDEVYRAYKENELRADDTYKNNRYQITAKVNGMSTGGLFNLTGGATLTMEKQIGNTIVFFYAEFEKEQEDALKTISVGDTITFEGECLSAGSWIECELLE